MTPLKRLSLSSSSSTSSFYPSPPPISSPSLPTFPLTPKFSSSSSFSLHQDRTTSLWSSLFRKLTLSSSFIILFSLFSLTLFIFNPSFDPSYLHTPSSSLHSLQSERQRPSKPSPTPIHIYDHSSTLSIALSESFHPAPIHFQSVHPLTFSSSSENSMSSNVQGSVNVNSEIEGGFEIQVGEGEIKMERCLGSEANERDINMLFAKGGEGTVVNLCRGSILQLGGEIRFTASRQVLQTVGSPNVESNLRALLNLTTVHTTAIASSGCINCDDILIQNIQLFGGRDVIPLPPTKTFPPALMELGNVAKNTTVRGCKIWGTRSWSCLHVADGGCIGARILENDIGPCGVSWNTGPIGDGVSFQCVDGIVANNTIVDATDGGIVIFGAPGTLVTNNTISNVKQHGLGGINMVDYIGVTSDRHNIPLGSFQGVIVEHNRIIAEDRQIKIGIAMGSPPWGDNLHNPLFGATVRYNHFSGTKMVFGLALAGVHHWSVYGNRVSSDSRFRGVKSGIESVDPCHDLKNVEPTFAILDEDKLPKEMLEGKEGEGGLGGERDCWRKSSFQFLLCYNPVPENGEKAIVEGMERVEKLERIGRLPDESWIEGGRGCTIGNGRGKGKFKGHVKGEGKGKIGIGFEGHGGGRVFERREIRKVEEIKEVKEQVQGSR